MALDAVCIQTNRSVFLKKDRECIAFELVTGEWNESTLVRSEFHICWLVRIM
jgi:hypothetical protein